VAILLQDYFKSSVRHMKTSMLDQMPPEFSSAVRQSNMSEGNDMLMVPNLDKHVFVRVLEDRGTIDLDPDGCVHIFLICMGILITTCYIYLPPVVWEARGNTQSLTGQAPGQGVSAACIIVQLA
jgi:hypothetical protein